MADKSEPGFWKGFAWGIFTPAILGIGATVLGSIVVAILGRKQMGDGS